MKKKILCAMLLAGMGSAYASVPTLTITGTVGNSVVNVNGYTGSIAYDPSAWFGKSFTLDMTPDATGVVKTIQPITNIPGATFNDWRPISVGYSLSIDGGASTFAGTDNLYSWLNTINNVTVPAGLTDLPPGIIADGAHTYDGFELSGSNILLACFSGGSNGVCDGEAADVYETASIDFAHYWDTASFNGIADNNLPNTQSLDFTHGVGSVDVYVQHWSADPTDAFDGNDIARIRMSVTGVTVSPVPEPESWGLMLSGLGFVGWAARRRRK